MSRLISALKSQIRDSASDILKDFALDSEMSAEDLKDIYLGVSMSLSSLHKVKTVGDIETLVLNESLSPIGYPKENFDDLVDDAINYQNF